MRFAVQSIVWGKHVADFGQMLRDAHDAGYLGIELFQDFTDPMYGGTEGIFNAILKERMYLVGVASGSLSERLRFAKDYAQLLGVSPSADSAPYAYIDEWNARCDTAVREGIRLGLHPHMFRPIQTMAEATKILTTFDHSTFPNLQLLPDTAHLTIAGDDPVETIKQQLTRIAAIHIKDWNPNVGRSYQFYASGFCLLGEGSVAVRDALKVLWTRHFFGWIVVEHDYSATPQATLRKSMEWLKQELPPHLFV